MDELVDKIIRLDKEGQARINALEKEKQQLSSYIKEMRETLGVKYDKARQEELDKFEIEIKSDYEVRRDNILNDTKEKEKNIASFYQKQKDIWLKQLLEFCLKD